jgi:hypothetical protein
MWVANDDVFEDGTVAEKEAAPRRAPSSTRKRSSAKRVDWTKGRR